jgi:ABC-type branched-subunit amino acid transport system substrate-binding protein
MNSSFATRLLLSSALSLGALGCSEANEEDAGTAIGALVPFTGISAASGSNYERAMLLAVEYLNRESGVSGEEFRLVAQDSHSTMDRTLTALDRLMEQRVFGVIGPDGVELVQGVREDLRQRDLVHVLPSSVTLEDFTNETGGLLLRPAPAAEFVGCALANRIYGDLNERLVVVHGSDAYRKAFASATVRSFESYRFAGREGQALALELSLDSEDYVRVVSEAAEFDPDTIVLAADAPVAAGFVRAWSTLRPERVGWFFEPALRSDAFLRNVIVSSVDGAAGISLALPDEAKSFDSVYAERWNGELPRVESHSYFDAVIAVGLATLAAVHDLGRHPTPEEVAPRVLSIVRGPGTSVSWKNLDVAVELIDQGRPIHYVGAAGRWTVDGNGASDGTAAIFGFWRIEEGRIIPERFGACPAGTIGAP